MSTDAEGLRELLSRWYKHEDQAACRELVRHLSAGMRLSRGFEDQLGKARVEEITQDTLVYLLDRKARRMADVRDPVSFVRKALKRRLVSELRTQNRRSELFEEHREAEHAARPTSTSADIERVQLRLDAERAIEVVRGLSYDQRMIVMLLLRPSVITPEDWEQLCERHPPPPPPLERPRGPVSEEKARQLLMPIAEKNTVARRRRNDNFRVARRRAADALRAVLEEEG